MQEAVPQRRPHETPQHQHYRADRRHGRPVAGGHPAEEIQGVSAIADPFAVQHRVGDQVADHTLRLKIKKVVGRQKQQRHDHGDEAFMLQLQADAGHHPPQRAGQRQHHKGEQHHHQNAACHNGGGKRHRDPIDDQCRHKNYRGIQKAHQIHAQQSCRHDGTDRDGQTQQLIVILGQIEAGIGIEHAAEGTQQDCQQAHQGKIEPVHSRRRQRAAQRGGQQREQAAQNAHHQHDEKHQIGGGGSSGTGLILLRIVKIAAEYFRKLLFQEDLQHDASSSSRKTCSSESSPLTSSMEPERMSRPSLMMATLSHSFSATSSTWVEKKMAPP